MYAEVPHLLLYIKMFRPSPRIMNGYFFGPNMVATWEIVVSMATNTQILLILEIVKKRWLCMRSKWMRCLFICKPVRAFRKNDYSDYITHRCHRNDQKWQKLSKNCLVTVKTDISDCLCSHSTISNPNKCVLKNIQTHISFRWTPHSFIFSMSM